jgi:hypothetical protein
MSHAVIVGSQELEDLREKAALLDWLCSQAQGHSLWLDGTCEWRITGSCTHGRHKAPLEAIKAAKAFHESQIAEYNRRPLQETANDV